MLLNRSFYFERAIPLLTEQQASPQQQVDLFMITQPMYQALQTLQLNNIVIGSTMTFKELYKAYKQQELLNHPDKAPGHATQFLAIQAAYETMESLLTHDENAYKYIYKAAFAKMDEDLNIIRQGIEKLQRDQEDTKVQQQEIKQVLEKIEEHQIKIQDQLDEAKITSDDFWALLEKNKAPTLNRQQSSPSNYLSQNAKTTATLASLHTELFSRCERKGHKKLNPNLLDEIKATPAWKNVK